MSAPSIAVPVASRQLGGVAWAVIGYAAFSISDATIKGLAGRYPVAQVAVVMALAVLPLLLAFARSEGGLRTLLPRSTMLVALRGALVAVCALSAWQAFSLLPLADAYAITFAAPILVTVLSGPMLGEKVGWRRWLAVALGFVGVLVMIRPGFRELSLGHLYALNCAATGALAMILLRKLGPRERAPAIFGGVLLGILLAALPLAIPSWVAAGPVDLAVMALAGLLQGAGHTCILRATKEAPASLIAPFQYTQMLWAVACGVLIFGDRVDGFVLIGVGIIVASGLYTLHREQVRGIEATAPALTPR